MSQKNSFGTCGDIQSMHIYKKDYKDSQKHGTTPQNPCANSTEACHYTNIHQPIYTNHFTLIHRKTNHYKETQIEFNYEIKDDKAKNNQILVMLSSFSTSYNVINISLVLPMRHTLKTFIGLCKNGIYF